MLLVQKHKTDIYPEYAQCRDWHAWPELLSISSKGGSYVAGYIFFILLSVREHQGI